MIQLDSDLKGLYCRLQRVWIGLSEKGLDFDKHEIDLRDDQGTASSFWPSLLNSRDNPPRMRMRIQQSRAARFGTSCALADFVQGSMRRTSGPNGSSA